MTTETIYQAFYDDDTARGFLHSHTHHGNALACRAALATLDIFEHDNIIMANRGKANYFNRLLLPLATHPRVKNFRNQGMIWAFRWKRPIRLFHRASFKRASRKGCVCVRWETLSISCPPTRLPLRKWITLPWARCGHWRHAKTHSRRTIREFNSRTHGAVHVGGPTSLYAGCHIMHIARFSCHFLLPSPAFSYNLPVAVHQALGRQRVPESAVGVYIHEIGSAQPLLQHNSGTVMNPASVMKLVTTYAGLELLGRLIPGRPNCMWMACAMETHSTAISSSRATATRS